MKNLLADLMDRRKFLAGAGIAASGAITRRAAIAQENRAGAASGGFPIVDSHIHIYSLDHARYPLTPVENVVAYYYKKRTNSAEQLLQAMQTANVDKAVVLQTAGVHGYDNSYIADSVARSQGQFAGVACVDPFAPDVVQQIRRWLAYPGVPCIRMMSHAVGTPPEHVRVPAVWEEMQQQRKPLKVHLLIESSAVGLPWLFQMMERYPSVQVVFDGMGNVPWSPKPPFGLQPLLDAAHLNFTLVFTGLNFTRWADAGVDPKPLLRLLVDRFGAKRVMWGSDVPHGSKTYAELAAEARNAVADLPIADQEWLLRKTALSVYPSLSATAESSL